MNCYIIDDESHCIESLQKHIVTIPDLELMGSSENPIEGLKAIKDLENIDLVFLDIEMPQLFGLDVADLLPASIAIIFTTGYAKYAFEAFEKNAVDFLFKPYSPSRFSRAVDKATKYLRGVKNLEGGSIGSLFVNAGVKGRVNQIHISEIIYIKSDDSEISIFTLDKEHVTHARLKEVEKRLSGKKFERIHRAYIVNMDFVKTIAGNYVIMTDGITLPIGGLYKQRFFRKIQHKLLK